MTGEGIKKKRDPIFSVCFVVFVVACVAVLGVYVNDHYLEKDETQVAFGDTVTVNYIGTYYAAYGQEGAVVFDTTLSGVGNDDSVIKSYDFSKGSYSAIKVTVGDDKYLQLFENSLMGHKVGDKFDILIPKDQAYSDFPSDTIYKDVSTTSAMEKVQTMTKAQFDAIYSDYKLTAGQTLFITSSYGWPAQVMYSNVTNTVTITHMPESGKTYDYIGNEDSEFGKVKFTAQDNGNELSVTITLEDTKKTADGIQMVKVDLDGKSIYITDYDGDTMSYKTCAERNDIDLYFQIEIVSITPVSENTSTTITG